MTPDEIKSIIDTIVAKKIKFYWVYVLIAILIGLASAFLISYSVTKAQNYANKSDIDSLTKVVEEIKFDYLTRLESIKGINDIKNPKRKELYIKVENLRSLYVEFQNNKSNMLDTLFESTKELFVFMSSNTVLDDMKSERLIIGEEYNSWVETALKKHGKGVSLDVKRASKALQSIHKKLLKP